MVRKQDKCRDCSKCLERGLTAVIKKLANAILILGTFGVSVLFAKMIHGTRRNCPMCGHPLSLHEVVGGRFKD